MHLGKGEIAMIQNNLPDGDRIYEMYTGVSSEFNPYRPYVGRILST